MRKRLDISTLEPTRYEVALYGRDQRLVRRLGFTARRTREALFGYARDNADELLGMMTEEEKDAEWTYDPGTGLVFGLGACAVAYTGRTERDCAQ